MVIGHGDVASALPEREDLLFFASGVSNSQETDESAYEREHLLLDEQDVRSHIVYFSSLAVFSGSSRYLMHKRQMEHRAKTEFDTSTIVRIGNITWGNNPNTLINAIRNKIANDEPFEIQDVTRYIVDKDEFLHWVDQIPDWSCEINIPGRRMKVEEIVDEYCYVGLHTK